MEQRTITITLNKAREWYKSDNAVFKELALQAFSKEELNTQSFQDITTFEDALEALGYKESTKIYIRNTINDTSIYSKASAAMFKLNIIRKALNMGYNLHLTKNVDNQFYTWHPCFKFVTKSSTYYDDQLRSGEYKKLGEITSEGVVYEILGGKASWGSYNGLGCLNINTMAGHAYSNVGFLGCATEEIAKHFGLHFGMLIMEAMYGDMIDFNIVK